MKIKAKVRQLIIKLIKNLLPRKMRYNSICEQRKIVMLRREARRRNQAVFALKEFVCDYLGYEDGSDNDNDNNNFPMVAVRNVAKASVLFVGVSLCKVNPPLYMFGEKCGEYHIDEKPYVYVNVFYETGIYDSIDVYSKEQVVQFEVLNA